MASDPLHQLVANIAPEKRRLLAELLRPAVEPVAIVGIGCRFPGGADSVDAFWDLLVGGRDATCDVPADRWDMDRFFDPDPLEPRKMYVRRGGFIPEIGMFDADFFGIAPQEALRMDPAQRLLMEVAWETLENAGYAADKLLGTQTGIFIGIMPNEFMMRQSSLDGEACFDDPYLASGYTSSMSVGRLSHFFDFRGPSISIDTACSSSLVAVHLACQSLRNGESELALAGGTNAILSPELFVHMCKLNMLARDGRCKTFDESADGFSAGEGCGMVALKRLSDARRDRDHIFAVICGSAVNEDGRTSTITAPNGLAQQAAIRKSLAAAKIDPWNVDYVEAHGSGTMLGDAIEIDALGAALGGGRPSDRPLIIGAVKTNIGHLEGAAGVAGLIKTALALERKYIPPSINLDRPNPKISWNGFPFVIPTRGVGWPTNGADRVAGVSAFGWAGTNAHATLQEAPAPQASSRLDRAELFVLSARSSVALENVALRLAAHLERHPEINLADAAYTLRIGRKAFNYRQAAVFHDRQQAIERLRQPVTAFRVHKGQSLAFLIPGLATDDQGVQQLYAVEPTFRHDVDECWTILRDGSGLDVELPFAGMRSGPVPRQLREMFRDAPHAEEYARLLWADLAAFIQGYALSRLFINFGLHPRALLGHGVGEYVAACIAEVMSIDQALGLLVGRARIAAELPPCVMLAVSLSEAAIQPYLKADVQLTAVNSPRSCVLAGSPTGISGVEHELKGARAAVQRLGTCRGYHSPLFRPAAAAFAGLVGKIALRSPRIPYLSNLTGRWMNADQATSPDYWVEHSCRCTRFEAAATELLGGDPGVLIEMGGQTLAAELAQNPAFVPEHLDQLVSAFVPNAQCSPRASVIAAVGRAWANGVEVKGDAVWAGEQSQRMPLPTYPFERRRYWFTPPADAPTPSAHADEDLVKEDFANWFHVPALKETAPRFPSGDDLCDPGECWILLEDSAGIARRVGTWLRDHGQSVVWLRPGPSYAQLAPDSYVVRPAESADFDEALRALRAAGAKPGRIVHAWTLTAQAADLPDLGLNSLIALTQALGNEDLEPRSMVIATAGIRRVTGLEHLVPERATVLGASAVMRAEYSALRCRTVDIALPEPGDSFDSILGELTSVSDDQLVVLRDVRRWVETFERLSAADESRDRLRKNGVYLITGGLGGVGLGLAERLVRDFDARVALVGRSAPNKRNLDAIAALGKSALVLRADVGVAAEIETAVRRTIERFGALHGVIHAAGVPGSGLIAMKQQEDVARVLHPKLQGTICLARALGGLRLDFLALFSSVTSAFGIAGQVDYAAANAFLDAYARKQHFRDHHNGTISLCWGEWQWNAWDESLKGYARDIQIMLQQRRSKLGIGFEEGFAAFRRSLAYGLPNVIISTQKIEVLADWAKRSVSMLSVLPKSSERFERPNLASSYAAPRNETETVIAAIWGELLGIEQIGIDDNFFELGGNSLVGLSLIKRIRRQLDIANLPAHALYAAPTVGALAQLLSARSVAGEQVVSETRGALRRQRRFERKDC
jgi:phthiocerol/phenolphthiocerol synthesis type-I polyketide synthase E